MLLLLIPRIEWPRPTSFYYFFNNRNLRKFIVKFPLLMETLYRMKKWFKIFHDEEWIGRYSTATDDSFKNIKCSFEMNERLMVYELSIFCHEEKQLMLIDTMRRSVDFVEPFKCRLNGGGS